VTGAGATRRTFLAAAAGFAASGAGLARVLEAAGQTAGSVSARIEGTTFSLENELIAARWEAPRSGLTLVSVADRRGGGRLSARRGAFALAMKGGILLDSAAMPLSGAARVEDLPPDPSASRFSARLPGRQVVAVLGDPQGRLSVTWRAILREGSHYVRQEIAVTALAGDLPIEEICLVDLDGEGASVRGTVRGSPVVAGSWFFAFEHPLASAAAGRRVRCSLERALPLPAGRSVSYSSVIGAAAPGQMRRDFARFVERERARPYRPFLHYNSWYDLGYFTPFDEAAALAVVEAFGTELHAKRGVRLDSFLFDDGWDDHRLWGFNAGFPNGFTRVREAAARYGAAPGVWLSPWGGYGKPREERLAFGKEQGFESNADGLALSGPVYYKRFREVCLEMIRRYGVNQFKLDGTGSSSTVVPGSAFGSDFEAAIALIRDLRAEKPDLYVNLTTGTYASPFWLFHADSIWRGGEDHDFAGVGSDRQRWITYRDADTFAGVVQKGPLYPLNSLMLHGLILAKHAKHLDADPGGDFPAEVRSYFGSGTQLQEMYVSRELVSDAGWDTLAEAATWSRENAATLSDTHWVGGDPARLEVYGWAAWSEKRAILTLRNPSDRAQEFEIDPAAAFELPENAAGRWRAKSPWHSDAARPALDLTVGRSTKVSLAAFEVATLEAAPLPKNG
jgi:hypothetical protein